MKRALVGLLVASAVLAGCGNDNTEPAVGQPSSAPADIMFTPLTVGGVEADEQIWFGCRDGTGFYYIEGEGYRASSMSTELGSPSCPQPDG